VRALCRQVVVLVAVVAAMPAAAFADATPIPQWHIQSSQAVSAAGEEVSTPGFGTDDWTRVSRRSTVMAGLIENGRYPDVFHSTNMQQIDPAQFAVPWWYRTEFSVGEDAPPHTALRLQGVISRADVWLNGTRIATRDQFVGAFNTQEIDVSHLVRPGANALALRVEPNDPQRDLTLGWIDWAPAPPDRNMGIWRDVEVVQDGVVSVRNVRVLPDLSLPDMERADLTVKADVRNNDDEAVTADVEGAIGHIRLSRQVRLEPGETRTVEFNPSTDERLSIRHPRVWWPHQMGEQPLYELRLAARVDGRTSDWARTTFGIRKVESRLNANGARQFLVNGEPLLIRGAGWASDLFLRYQPRRLEDQIRYVRDMGLNAVRTEGKLEHDEFYDLADRYGIMILPGWECCDKWEPWTDWGGEDWVGDDFRVARESMESEARRLRNHPSVIAFLIASDWAPPADVESIYVNALRQNDWPTPIVAAAASRGEPAILEHQGTKMEGPYDWVPPSYWYSKQLGGAFGFASELGAGKSIPTLDSLRKMLSPAELEDLWRNPESVQYHSARPEAIFASLKLYNTSLAARFGRPTSLADYVEKAQLHTYENVRAQFEAYGREMTTANQSTGLIYWMLNNAWPSLHWHLFDYYLKPSGAYYGAKKANEPLHVQYSYDDRSVVVVNHRPGDARGLRVKAAVYNLDGSRRFSTEARLEVGSNDVARALTIPELTGLSQAYLVRLTLTDRRGRTVSRNTYWLSTEPDVPDWANSDWYYTPVTQYAQLSSLATLPRSRVRVRAESEQGGTTEVALRNTSSTVALGLRVTLRDAAGAEVLPVTWSDNHVALWPGESITLRATHREGGRPRVDVEGWNLRR
jgi:exo-1,4-beta-D-glucosaminidase